ncbi:MAG: hypothetical protein KF729_31175 [Sandaracinaceae bacterium]|nr:hypothetical protein [Sandaracinaceae bacterium]
MRGPPREAPRALTLTGADLELWSDLPLPLSELGLRLDAGQEDYFLRLLELVEDAVVLVVALSLVRLEPRAASTRARALELSSRPSFGARVDLLWLLADGAPRGWDPRASAESQRALIELVNPESVPRRPTVRDLFAAIVKLRNDSHHRRLGAREEATRGLERAVFWLLRQCPALTERLYWVDEVRRTSEGTEELRAWSLWGPKMARFRRGQWQPTRPGVVPGRVYHGELVDPVALHPFFVVRDERLYVLDEVKGAKGVLRHFASRQALEPPASLGDVWPDVEAPRIATGDAGTRRAPVSLGVSRQTAGAAMASEWSDAVEPPLRRRRWPGAVLVAALVFATVLFVAVGSWRMRDDEPVVVPAPASGAIALSPGASTCPTAPGPERRPPAGLPHALTGAPLEWRAMPSALARACPATLVVDPGGCRTALVEIRSTTWAPAWPIPSHTGTHVAFHRTHGLFEVMVYSGVDVAELAAFAERRLGPPHRTEERGRVWEYPDDAVGGETRLRVSPLAPGHSLGRSAIRLTHPPVAAIYAQEMRASGCRR